ncbi:molybdenum cofactor biosynthesis protein MoaE [Paenibacillus aurantius]|uniref:Molybdopterin synthase catalytic subunit n=1 Tax=Paenibacillus aurantius TaxID=2918900 RepID=A0AA96RDP4_9BACL|nr:molybdenum cofactor biosynthesis protein MoaE [Paenibacillus aurantius]WNQ09987.1 molybdenum cofactor biosynthesis protein MoaE [Paenibacillus aurantius]
MKLTIQLFAGLAERLGSPNLTVDIPDGPVTADGLKQLIARDYPESAQAVLQSFVARNQAYAPGDTALSEEDELALIPPVSGGQSDGPSAETEEPLFVVHSSPISVEAVTAKVIHPHHGAALTFVGTTREFTHGKRTIRLEYDAYVPMALSMLERIGIELDERWPGTRCAITHRIGPVDLAEASVVIAVSSPHREACYEASRYAIERLKQIVPIWKKEIWEDGSEWKGHQQGPWNPIAGLADAPEEGRDRS